MNDEEIRQEIREEISIREFARRIEVSFTTAWKAVKRGRISSSGEGRQTKIPWPLAKREFELKRDNSKIREKDFRRLGVNPKKPGYKHGKNGKVSAIEKIDLWEERARKEKWLARLRELDYLERSAELVSAKAVEDAAFEAARRLRDDILNIPDRIASLIAAEDRPVKCHQILKTELELALKKLSEHWV